MDAEYAEALVKTRMGWYRNKLVALDSLAVNPPFNLPPTKIIEANFNGGYSGWTLADYQRDGELRVSLRGTKLIGDVYRRGKLVASEVAIVKDVMALLASVNTWANHYLVATGIIGGVVRPNAARVYFGPSVATSSKLHKFGLPGALIITADGRFGTIWHAWAGRRAK